MNQWYYAVDKERKGPISEAEFEDLKQQGVITAETLVWKTGLSQWLPLAQVESQAAVQPGIAFIAKTQARCAHSNGIYEKTEMFQYGVHWIANEHREAFLQSLREGRVLPTKEATTGGIVYGGFWWRVLGIILDGMVTGLASCLLTFPLMLLMGGMGAFMGGGLPGPASQDAGMDGALAMQGVNILFQLVSYILGMAITIGYEMLMVGSKNQGTLGKMALGFKVVQPDFSRVSYGRAAWRAFCKQFINGICTSLVIGVYVGIAILVIGVANLGNLDGLFKEGLPTWLIVYICFAPLVMLLAMFPYWMAAFTKQKTALHDLIAGTRVVRK
jgi:uncharacterized RDD family membrane protein YckC